ncbi:hypothetical protein HYPP_03784 [Hyphomicrobium sp. ghe19]|nr:hypothetical protein HYPP_03784 [Hyphomicrobium sp. ghe19]
MSAGAFVCLVLAFLLAHGGCAAWPFFLLFAVAFEA